MANVGGKGLIVVDLEVLLVLLKCMDINLQLPFELIAQGCATLSFPYLPCIDSVDAIAGITALEMAEGKPPYGDIHPMRVCMVNSRLVLCGVTCL